METANCPKRLRRGFHRVPTDRAVHMKIDKTGREIVSSKIDNVFSARTRLFTNCRDFSLVSNEFEPIADSIGKN